MKMWIGFTVFMGLPIGIMVLAWVIDRLDCYVNRPTDRPMTDRPRPLDR
jgi:hypothetical protein